MKKWFSVLCCSFLLTSMAMAADQAPDEVIKKTAGEVLTAIRNDPAMQAGDKQKIYTLIEEKILPNFDLDRVNRLVLGKHWKTATAEQKIAFRKEFREFVMRTYAAALSEYKGQEIQYKQFRAEDGAKIVTVNTQISQPSGPPLAVDYHLGKTNDGWKVFDIVVENVSLVANYRGQFSSEIEQGSLDSLIKKLAEKNKTR